MRNFCKLVPVNFLNIRRTLFLKNTSGRLLLYTWKWIQHMPTGIHLFRVKIAKLQSTKLTIKTQISHFVVVLFFLTLNMQMSTWLNFNLSHRKKNKPEADLGPTDHLRWSSLWQYNIRKSFHITMQLQLRWWRNRKAASGCYQLQFPWENWKHGRGEKLGGLKHFTYWYLISFLDARENNLLLSLLRNGSS